MLSLYYDSVLVGVLLLIHYCFLCGRKKVFFLLYCVYFSSITGDGSAAIIYLSVSLMAGYGMDRSCKNI